MNSPRTLLARPDSAGWWLWYEGLSPSDDFEDCAPEPERLLIVNGGHHVADDEDYLDITGRSPDVDAWTKNYWAGTETTQEEMPGLWERAPES